MNLKELFGYENKNVIITGASSGMAKSACELLIELGANVYAIDINPIDLPVTKSFQADLGRKETIERIIKELPDKIDAIFLCHAIAGFKGKELEVQLVNFYGQKYMLELLLPKVKDQGSITFISSVGGFGYEANYQNCLEIININDWDEAVNWYQNHPKLIENSYVFAKQCMNTYVTSKCMSKEFITRKIRINAICPGYTITGLTDDFNKSTSATNDAKEGQAIIENMFINGWNGYPASPKDMAYPLVTIGSNIFSYTSGECIYIDYGLTSNWKHQSLTNSPK